MSRPELPFSRIAHQRTTLGISQAMLAGMAGVSRSTIQRIEREECVPTLDQLGRLAKVLGVPWERLVEPGWVEPPREVPALADIADQIGRREHPQGRRVGNQDVLDWLRSKDLL